MNYFYWKIKIIKSKKTISKYKNSKKLI